MATPLARRPLSVSIAHRPECSVPVRPATDAHQAAGLVERGRLAAGLAVDVEHGVAAEHDGGRSAEALGHGGRLALGQHEGHLVGRAR